MGSVSFNPNWTTPFCCLYSPDLFTEETEGQKWGVLFQTSQMQPAVCLSCPVLGHGLPLEGRGSLTRKNQWHHCWQKARSTQLCARWQDGDMDRCPFLTSIPRRNRRKVKHWLCYSVRTGTAHWNVGLCRVGTSAAEQHARPSTAQNHTKFLSLTLFFLRVLVQVSHLAGP